ncbi:nicotinate-nucleotide adenylyltransferase [Pseudoalteromonas sp.]|uniref:nicotinate-nucleotide adenylyltransferase n=1 Tax=Pseudoalteromonas sp. TaxID=53249 RepID=UPI00356975C8
MIVILGGTFDPIHSGHLALAKQANQLLKPDKVLFMPCKQPVHKATSGITSAHRINMINLAIQNDANFAIELREINRDTPSYALESLISFRQQYPTEPIFFLIGMDSLNTLHTWFKWQECLANSNFLVFQRPGETFQPDPQVAPYIQGNINDSLEQLPLAGHIYLAQHQQVAISSSELRSNLMQLKNDFLPEAVSDYIKQHRLYQ